MNKFSLSRIPRKHLLKIIIVLTSVSASSFAYLLRSNAQQSLIAETSLFRQQQAVNNMAGESAMLLTHYMGQYSALQQQGIIGTPRRLQWLESVQTNAGYHLVPNLNFILSPTELTTDTDPFYYNPEFETKTTLMQVYFTLLHEGDFYHLLNGLQLDSKGVFDVEECVLRRNKEISLEDYNEKLEGSLAGSCQLRWYSIADITQNWEASVP